MKNTFAAKLFPSLGKNDKNCFFSPFSVQVAMGMCSAGAEGETAKSLAELLDCPLDKKEQASFFKNLVELGTAKNESYELCTANALWGQKGLNYDPQYSETILNAYNGNFGVVDYIENANGAVGIINEWCNNNTKGKIPEIINSSFVNRETRLVLTNAIYFKGKWETEFNKKNTKLATFTEDSGKKSQVSMMKAKDGFLYGETDFYKVLDIPYQGRELSMMVILPNEKLENLNPDISNLYEEARTILSYEDEVSVSLPKFKMSTEYKFAKTFQELGAALAFSDYADFKGITKDVALKISEVIHKAFVQCDEEGTEAAAATAVGMVRCTSMRISTIKEFNANHPFLFFIHSQNGNILFAGRVASLPDEMLKKA